MQTLRRTRALAIIASVLIIVASLEVFSTVKAEKKKKDKDEKGTPVLWRDPGDMRKRDLYYGPGSEALAPKPPLKFIKEVKEGSQPKFEVEDANGVRWRVKLGEEAQAETAASRLVWAAGYNAEESYYFNRVNIEGLKKLSRGQKYVQGNSVVGARFESRRGNIKRGKEWSWRDNPFKNTRELNGLKTMMVLTNNWDTFKKNNKVLHNKDTNEARYTVTDLGATMGRAAGIGAGRSKNNVRDYTRARFVKKVDGDNVKFAYDLHPKKLGWFSAVDLPYFIRHHKATKTMNKVPISDAAWIGAQLAQLSDEQLRDAFRAAGYDRATQDAYARAVKNRINQLNRLRDTEMASRPRKVR